MIIKLDQLKPGALDSATPTGTVQVIMKVRDPGYVPSEATVRARIDEHLFTADVPADGLARLQENPKVVSVVANKKLRIVD